MSSQGSASNSNGRALQDRCEAIFGRVGLLYERDVARYPGLGPVPPKHDFVIQTWDGPRVVECKSFSDMKGTIWQKIPYAIDLLAAHGVPSLLVLGGSVPQDWRYGYLAGRCRSAGVVMV